MGRKDFPNKKTMVRISWLVKLGKNEGGRVGGRRRNGDGGEGAWQLSPLFPFPSPALTRENRPRHSAQGIGPKLHHVCTTTLPRRPPSEYLVAVLCTRDDVLETLRAIQVRTGWCICLSPQCPILVRHLVGDLWEAAGTMAVHTSLCRSRPMLQLCPLR